MAAFDGDCLQPGLGSMMVRYSGSYKHALALMPCNIAKDTEKLGTSMAVAAVAMFGPCSVVWPMLRTSGGAPSGRVGSATARSNSHCSPQTPTICAAKCVESRRPIWGIACVVHPSCHRECVDGSPRTSAHGKCDVGRRQLLAAICRSRMVALMWWAEGVAEKILGRSANSQIRWGQGLRAFEQHSRCERAAIEAICQLDCVEGEGKEARVHYMHSHVRVHINRSRWHCAGVTASGSHQQC